MKIGIIIGSHRTESESARMAKFIIEQLHKLFNMQVDVYTLDLGKTPLPLWDESKHTDGSKLKQAFTPISEKLHTCDSFIIITPEWSGMVPAALKNFFLLCDRGELAHKPALITAISSGVGGAYPIAELRMSSYKNTFINYIPDQIIIRSVNKLFDSKTSDSNNPDSTESYIKERLDYALSVLHEYTKALKIVRTSDVINLKKYPFGM
jgi:NAD(P)H-dependent FMN reductase